MRLDNRSRVETVDPTPGKIQFVSLVTDFPGVRMAARTGAEGSIGWGVGFDDWVPRAAQRLIDCRTVDRRADSVLPELVPLLAGPEGSATRLGACASGAPSSGGKSPSSLR